MKDDVIYRQAAIDAKQEFRNPNVVRSTEARTAYDRTYANGWNDCNSAWIDVVKDLPSAQPEQKTGKWIFIGDGYKCSECKSVYSWWADSQTSNYCPNCGTEMSDETE